MCSNAGALTSYEACCCQVMVFKSLADQHGGLKRLTATGTSVMVQGEIKQPPQGKQQVRVVKFNQVNVLSVQEVCLFKF